MAGAAIAPAIIGGAIGVTGSFCGTILALAWTGQRESRAAALETAQHVVGLEQHVWSQNTGGPELLGLLRQVGVRLQAAGLPDSLRLTFGNVCYTCWLATTRQGDGAPRIGQDLLKLRSEVEQVVLAHVLGRGLMVARWRRRRQRAHLEHLLDGHNLISPPGPVPDRVLRAVVPPSGESLVRRRPTGAGG